MIKIKFTKENVLSWIKTNLVKNFWVKLSALIFALILWGYVLADSDPYRVKTITEVPLSFDGEAELFAQGLCVRGSRSEILSNVDVAVRTRITNYAVLGSNAVTATISLKNISRAQEYRLPIHATVTSALGVVQQVYPANITVEIDSLVTKTIPVSCIFTGEIPEGYWADTEALSSTTRLEIQGARTDVARISRAECVIDLSERTKSVIGTFDVVLFDSDNNEVDNEVLIGSLPACTVYLPIYPMRTVPVDTSNSILGIDKLAANYELASVVTTPQTVRIVGEQAVIDAVESVSVEPFSVSGMNEGSTFKADLAVPTNVRILDGNQVDVSLDIRETSSEAEFVQIPVKLIGLEKGLFAEVIPETVDVTVSGRTSVVTLIKRSDVHAEIDLTDLMVGMYNLPINVFVRDEESTIELTIELNEKSALVTIDDGSVS